MRTAVLITLSDKAKVEYFADVQEARTQFKARSVSTQKPEVTELQLWESDAGVTKRKRFGTQRVAQNIEKFKDGKLPKDNPNEVAPESFLDRQNKRILEVKAVRAGNRDREAKGQKPLPVPALLQPESVATSGYAQTLAKKAEQENAEPKPARGKGHKKGHEDSADPAETER